MAFPLLRTRPDFGLSYFTEEEALASEITRADRVYWIDEDGANSTFVYWIFEIKDDLGNLYEWRDFSLSGTSYDLGDIGVSVVTHIRNNLYKLNYPSTIEDQEGVFNSVTVGDGDEGVGMRIKEAVNS